MTKVVIGADSLASALLFGGVPGGLVPLWKSGAISPLISPAIMEEYLRILAYPEFQLTEQEIGMLVRFEVLPWFEIVLVEEGRLYVNANPAGDKFIWCARAGGAATLITEDQHLLNLKHCPVEVLTPADFIRTFE